MTKIKTEEIADLRRRMNSWGFPADSTAIPLPDLLDDIDELRSRAELAEKDAATLADALDGLRMAVYRDLRAPDDADMETSIALAEALSKARHAYTAHNALEGGER